MEEKMFELIEKMYAEMNEQFKNVNKKLDEKANKKDIAVIENTVLPKTQIALEGYQAVFEKLQEHDKRFDELSEKIEKQDLEIKVVKAVK